MRNYVIIIFIFLDLFIIINYEKLKTLKKFKLFINFLAFIEAVFIFWIFYSGNEGAMVNFIYNIKAKFIEVFLYAHKIISSELKL